MKVEDLPEETRMKMAEFFLRTSVPRILEEMKSEKTIRTNSTLPASHVKKNKPRKIRGAKKLSEYLSSIDCPMSPATIFRLMRTHDIPFRKPSPRVLIFDLDEIDAWLGSDYEKKSGSFKDEEYRYY
jgi:hypothetical protein